MFLKKYLPNFNDKNQYRALMTSSLTMGLASLALNFFTFGAAGVISGILGCISIASVALGFNQKKNLPESDGMSKLDKVSLGAVVCANVLNVFTFGIGGTVLTMLGLLGLSAYELNKDDKSTAVAPVKSAA